MQKVNKVTQSFKWDINFNLRKTGKQYMLRSMTGYGTARGDNAHLNLNVQIKSVNGRYLDLNLRLPKQLSDYEQDLRSKAQKTLQRGSVSIIVEAEYHDLQLEKKELNVPLLQAYYADIQQVRQCFAPEASDGDVMRQLLMMPDVFSASEKEPDDNDLALLMDVFDRAFEEFDNYRKQEGESLKQEFKKYISKIRELTKKVDADKEGRIKKIKERLEKALNELKTKEDFDEGRLEQELVFYAEKLDITEEIVRLSNNLDYFEESLDVEDTGKKLNFIAQEIGREINTMGSKANDSAIQRQVVEMKDELEKIKEQVLNIL